MRHRPWLIPSAALTIFCAAPGLGSNWVKVAELPGKVGTVAIDMDSITITGMAGLSIKVWTSIEYPSPLPVPPKALFNRTHSEKYVRTVRLQEFDCALRMVQPIQTFYYSANGSSVGSVLAAAAFADYFTDIAPDSIAELELKIVCASGAAKRRV